MGHVDVRLDLDPELMRQLEAKATVCGLGIETIVGRSLEGKEYNPPIGGTLAETRPLVHLNLRTDR